MKLESGKARTGRCTFFPNFVFSNPQCYNEILKTCNEQIERADACVQPAEKKSPRIEHLGLFPSTMLHGKHEYKRLRLEFWNPGPNSWVSTYQVGHLPLHAK
jgi:hypothetical protein